MGRTLSGAFGAGTISQGVFDLKTGANVAQNDLLELGPSALAYPVKVTDYAAVSSMAYGTVQTGEATGRIVAQTQVVGGQTLSYYRQSVLQGTDGTIYTFTANSGSNGMLLRHYTAGGALLAQVTIDGSTAFVNHQAFFLSNGNICVIAGVSSGSISFAIYDPLLNVIKSITALAEVQHDAYFAATTLSGGGFAVVYQQKTNTLLSRLVTYDNTGAAVLAPTTVWTRTGTSSPQVHKIAQLSNGHLVIAVNSQGSTAPGFFHGIVTTSGAPVLAFTNLATYVINSTWPELCVANGYYAIAYSTSASAGAVSVFDNTGVLQGAPLSSVGNLGVGNKSKLLLGNGNFWFIAPTEGIAKIPFSGTGYATYNLSSNGTLYAGYIDAFYDQGFIVIVAQQAMASNLTPSLWVFNESTSMLMSTSGTGFGGQPGTAGGQYHRVIPGGDFSFICLYDYNSTAATNFCVGKYANSAVMGVAQAAAASGSLVPTATPAGGYSCNQLAGSPTKTFDHSAANIYGNKGAMLTYGVTLKGM